MSVPSADAIDSSFHQVKKARPAFFLDSLLNQKVRQIAKEILVFLEVLAFIAMVPLALIGAYPAVLVPLTAGIIFFECFYAIDYLDNKLRPEIVPRPRTPDSPIHPFCKIEKCPPTKHLVLSGGGTKGYVLPSYIKTLDDSIHFISDLEEIAGSSAGAMMAFLLASGIPIAQIETKYNALGFRDPLLDCNNKAFHESFTFTAGSEKQYSATQLMYTMHQDSVKSALDELTPFITSHKAVDKYEKYEALSKEFGKDPIDKFFKRAKKQFDLGLTFRELAILHAINPKRFKLLHITGTKHSDLNTQYYAYNDHYADMRCIDAVRISMAIPNVMRSIEFEGETVYDGGVSSNAPLEVFSSREGYKPFETMLLAFKKGDRTEKILHHTHDGDEISFNISWLAKQSLTKLFGENIPRLVKRLRITNKDDADKIRSLGPNVAQVPHGSLSTVGTIFAPGFTRIKPQALKEARLAAAQYAKMHDAIAIHTSYATADELRASLREADSKRFYEQMRRFEATETSKVFCFQVDSHTCTFEDIPKLLDDRLSTT